MHSNIVASFVWFYVFVLLPTQNKALFLSYHSLPIKLSIFASLLNDYDGNKLNVMVVAKRGFACKHAFRGLQQLRRHASPSFTLFSVEKRGGSTYNSLYNGGILFQPCPTGQLHHPNRANQTQPGGQIDRRCLAGVVPLGFAAVLSRSLLRFLLLLELVALLFEHSQLGRREHPAQDRVVRNRQTHGGHFLEQAVAFALLWCLAVDQLLLVGFLLRGLWLLFGF